MAEKLYRVELERKVTYKMVYLVTAESPDDAEYMAVTKDRDMPADIGTVWCIDRDPKIPQEVK